MQKINLLEIGRIYHPDSGEDSWHVFYRDAIGRTCAVYCVTVCERHVVVDVSWLEDAEDPEDSYDMLSQTHYYLFFKDTTSWTEEGLPYRQITNAELVAALNKLVEPVLPKESTDEPNT